MGNKAEEVKRQRELKVKADICHLRSCTLVK